jgi:hypothetical protein
MESYAIFTDNIEQNLGKIQYIKEYLQKRNSCDFFIFTDDYGSSFVQQTTGVFPYFYMRYFHGTTIFLDYDQYMEHKDSMFVEPYLFVESNQECPDNCNVLTLI